MTIDHSRRRFQTKDRAGDTTVISRESETHSVGSLAPDVPKEEIRKKRNRQAMRNWEAILPALASGLNQRSANPVSSCGCNSERLMTLVSFSDAKKQAVPFCNCPLWPTTLVASGYFPGSPNKPSMVFEVHMLGVLSTILSRGSISKEAYAEGIREYIQRTNPSLVASFYDQLRDALSTYNRAMRVAKGVPNELAPLRALCPCCFLDNSSAVVVAVDGNFQHKRLRNVGKRAAIPSEIDRRIFLENISLDKANMKIAKEVTREGCEANFKAASATKKSSNFDETGLMIAVCRHDIPLRALNIVRTGERYDYALALVRSILCDSSCPPRVLVSYDISCKFDSYARRVMEEAEYTRLEFMVPSFHITTHNYSCHLLYHATANRNAGLTDGEGCERVWSAIRYLVSSGRYSQPYVRTETLSCALAAVGQRKRMSMWTWFATAEKRAMAAVEMGNRELSPVLGKEKVINGRPTIITMNLLEEKIEACTTFYTNHASSERDIKDPRFIILYDAVNQYAIQGNNNGAPMVALLEAAGQSRQDWAHKTGVAWLQCHKEMLTVRALRLQRELWKHTSAKLQQFRKLRSNTVGTKRAGIELAKVAKAGKKTKQLLADYNSAAQELNDFTGTIVARHVNLNELDTFSLGSPIWDLDRAAPTMVWAREAQLFGWMLSFRRLTAAKNEIKQLQVERSRYYHYIRQSVDKLNARLAKIDEADVQVHLQVISEIEQFTRLLKIGHVDVPEEEEVYMDAAAETLQLMEGEALSDYSTSEEYSNSEDTLDYDSHDSEVEAVDSESN